MFPGGFIISFCPFLLYRSRSRHLELEAYCFRLHAHPASCFRPLEQMLIFPV